MAATTFNTIFKQFQLNPVDARTKSQAWINRQAEKLGKPKASQVMRHSNHRNRGNALIGNMYFFYYNAKHRDTLPVWDKFPLVFPFSIHPDGFTGLNFHYLPFGSRIYLLDSLLSINNQKLDANTQLKLSWSTIKGVSKLNFAEVAVHRYLMGYLASPLKLIEPLEWETALALPVQQFVGNTGKPIRPNKVWGTVQ